MGALHYPHVTGLKTEAREGGSLPKIVPGQAEQFQSGDIHHFEVNNLVIFSAFTMLYK